MFQYWINFNKRIKHKKKTVKNDSLFNFTDEALFL